MGLATRHPRRGRTRAIALVALVLAWVALFAWLVAAQVDGVAKAMAERYRTAEESTDGYPVPPLAGACPDCGGELRQESGCVVCAARGCGFSRCS